MVAKVKAKVRRVNNIDYCELFKSWFGDGVEQKIIESAVIFWFKDDDYRDGFKLGNYFKED